MLFKTSWNLSLRTLTNSFCLLPSLFNSAISETFKYNAVGAHIFMMGLLFDGEADSPKPLTRFCVFFVLHFKFIFLFFFLLTRRFFRVLNDLVLFSLSSTSLYF